MRERLKLKPYHPAAPLLDMTAEEAEAALAELNASARTFAERLVDFERRRGWQALGYPDCRSCLKDRLKIGERTVWNLLHAARARAELAQAAGTRELVELAWRLSDNAALTLAKVADPLSRLQVLASVAKNGAAAVQLTVPLIRRAIRRSGCRVVVREGHPKGELCRCPFCRGTGHVSPLLKARAKLILAELPDARTREARRLIAGTG